MTILDNSPATGVREFASYEVLEVIAFRLTYLALIGVAPFGLMT